MGCCICKKIEKEKKNDTQLCIELNDAPNSKHLSVIQQINGHTPNESSPENKLNDYKLNDLRSLEGVARLWSKKLESDSKLSFLQKSKSTPIIGNMYKATNALSPLSISTYFFQHSPPNQMNLLRSHSDHMGSNLSTSPNNIDKKPPKSTKYNELTEALTPQLEMNINQQNNNRFKQVNNYNNYINYYNNSGANSAANSGTSTPMTPQKFSSLSAANLRSPYLTMNLSPLQSDNDDNDIEMEIEIEIEIENEEDDIFTVIENMENQFTLRNEDFVTHTCGKLNNLGVGASGIVTKAFHFASCKMLGIKQCRSLQKNKLLAFEKEANLYRKFIGNKYIIQIIGIGKGDKNNELIMGLDYMDLNSCQSLQIHKNIKDIKTKELVVGYIGYNVLMALEELHKHLYIHNDVKPANILVNKYGEIKLSDFDTVLQLKNKDDFLTRNNGTQKYQSPEKVIFATHYSTNADIWSLGVSLYELLYGEKEYTNDHDEVSYTTNPPKLLSSNSNDSLSENCCDFMNKCLILKREDRPEACELLKHVWLEQDIKSTPLKDKWPWLINVEDKTNEYNEDLLFMINALIYHYSTRKFSTAVSKSASFPTLNNINMTHMQYSDEERIANMAKYAYCTKDTVLDRIRVTVAYIKSQLNKMDIQ